MDLLGPRWFLIGFIVFLIGYLVFFFRITWLDFVGLCLGMFLFPILSKRPGRPEMKAYRKKQYPQLSAHYADYIPIYNSIGASLLLVLISLSKKLRS